MPGVVTAAGPDPTATADEEQWWGTAPAVAGVVGAVVAGTIAAAGAAANRDRGDQNGDQTMGDGPRLDSDGVIRVSGPESPVEMTPTPVEMILNDGPKGNDLPTIDVDPSGRAEGAISALPTLESVSAHDAAMGDGPSVLAGGATGEGGPVEADNRSAAGSSTTQPGPPPAHAAGLGGTPGMTPGATPGAGPAGTTPTVTAGTTSTPTSLATGTGIATPTGGAGATAAHTGATGGTTSPGGTGFGGGLEDRSWQTDGRMTWGDETADPTSITRPEAGLEFDEPEEHA